MKTYLTTRLLLVFLFLFSFFSYAQQQNNYSLLWKIESKTHKKTSYLFGTMHIDDARAFNFSDAVLPAIKNCEKFALEIQPDSIAIKMVPKRNAKKAYLAYKDVLSPEEYKIIADRFFEVNGYPIEESNQSDPNILITMLNPERNDDDDKKTFVDMHLLGHAKTMQKKIVGLEKIDDQLDAFEKLNLKEQREFILSEIKSDIPTYNTQLELLTKIYLTGDINKIHEIVKSYDGYDAQLKSRNKVMCKSIIKEMENSSIFSAVGAAHLPGKIGLIKLLRDKGFKVTPVEANFTGVANTFKIDPLKMEWKKFTDDQMGYTVETPGIINIDSTSYANFNLNSYADIISKKYYTFFTLDIRQQVTEDNKAFLYDRIISNTSSKYNATILSNKKVTINNVDGYELVMKKNNPDSNSPFTGIRSLYLINNGVFYQFLVLDDIETIENGSITRFFNSVKFKEPKPKKEKEWFTYHSEKGAFSVHIPSAPKDASQEVENPYEKNEEPYKLNLYLVNDSFNNNNYLFRYNDLPTGYHVVNLEESFALMRESLLSNSNALISTKKIILNGYEGREYELLLEDNYHAICKIYIRGNRTYLLLSQKNKIGKKTNPNNRFFKSFKFENFSNEEALVSKTTHGFKFKTLDAARVVIDSTGFSESYFVNSTSYFSKNPSNGDFYSFEFSKLKRYFKIDNIDDFYTLNKENLVDWNDSIINQKKIKIGEIDALEFHKINKKDKLNSRYVLWLDNNYLFVSSAFNSKETINSRLTDSLLKNYTPNKKRKTIDYFASKTDHIVNDLKSKDSTIFKNALGALTYYDFETSDLKKLYKTVNLDAAKNNEKLVIDAVVEVLNETNNSKTLGFLNTLYLKPGLDEKTRRAILYQIPKLKNTNRLSVYANLLLKHPPKENNSHDYGLFLPFRDSIKFAIANYKPLIKLRNIKEFRRNILEISALILKSDDQNSMTILSSINDINEYSSSDLEAYLQMIEDDGEYNYKLHSLIDSYLTLFYNTPITTNDAYIDSFTKKVTDSKANKWITFNAVKARLKHNFEVETATRNFYLDNLDTRFTVMKAYYDSNKLNEVPSAYIKPEKFSKLSLNEFLNHNDEYPKETRLLKKINKNNRLFYVYSMVFDSETLEDTEDVYLAVVGPCKKIKQESAFKRYEVHTKWGLIKADWEKQAIDLLPRLNEIALD